MSRPVGDLRGPASSLSPDGRKVLYTMHDGEDPIHPLTPANENCSPADEKPYQVVALDLRNGSAQILREGTCGVLSPRGDQLAFQTCERKSDKSFTVCGVHVAGVSDVESSMVGPGGFCKCGCNETGNLTLSGSGKWILTSLVCRAEPRIDYSRKYL